MKFSIRTVLLLVIPLAASFALYFDAVAANRFEVQTADELRSRFRGGVIMRDEEDSLFPRHRIEEICLAAKGLTDDDFRRICRLREVREVKIGRSDVTDEGLKYIANLKHLEVLSLSSSSISDRGTEVLARLQELRVLNLRNTKLTDASVSRLVKITGLEQLLITKTLLSPDGVEELRAALPDCTIK